MKSILLQAPGFLGDEVVFTGVVRELKKQTGWSLRVKTRRPDLWLNHASIDGLEPRGDEEVVIEDDHCPPYYNSNQSPVHFLERYLQDMRTVLGLEGKYRIHKFAGEVRVTEEEMQAPPVNLPERYWIVVAGWKGGNPTKAWPVANCQQVVDTLRGRIPFVQVGVRGSWHPPLRGVTNLVGKTNLRQLISLIYHAEGVVCPITSIMHLAAAIPASKRSPFAMRPCVVVAGGREPPHYIAYPMHRIVNVVGQLDCCATGGCGKSRFGPGQCPYPTEVDGKLVPRCMTLIKPSDVVAAIEFYYRGTASLPPRLGKVDALFARLKKHTAAGAELRGAQIGISAGEMSAQLLRGNDQLRLTMVQVLQGGDRQANRKSASLQTKALDATQFAASRREMVTHTPTGAAHAIEDASLDFVFVNADREYAPSSQDLDAWLPKLKPGGFIGGCGYDRPSVTRGHVKQIVDEFASWHQLKVERDKDSTWFIQVAGTQTN